MTVIRNQFWTPASKAKAMCTGIQVYKYIPAYLQYIPVCCTRMNLPWKNISHISRVFVWNKTVNNFMFLAIIQCFYLLLLLFYYDEEANMFPVHNIIIIYLSVVWMSYAWSVGHVNQDEQFHALMNLPKRQDRLVLIYSRIYLKLDLNSCI